MPDAPPPVPPAQPAPPTAPARSSAVPKVLVGCLAAVVVAGLVVGGLVMWGVYKVKRFADDATRNPAAATVKLLAAANPDIEVVSQDDAGKSVTFRDKRTGKTLTASASEKGKVVFTDERGEQVAFDAGDAAKGAMTVTTKEGTTVVGQTGAEGLPSWVPVYPGATPQGTFTSRIVAMSFCEPRS